MAARATKTKSLHKAHGTKAGDLGDDSEGYVQQTLRSSGYRPVYMAHSGTDRRLVDMPTRTDRSPSGFRPAAAAQEPQQDPAAPPRQRAFGTQSAPGRLPDSFAGDEGVRGPAALPALGLDAPLRGARSGPRERGGPQGAADVGVPLHVGGDFRNEPVGPALAPAVAPAAVVYVAARAQPNAPIFPADARGPLHEDAAYQGALAGVAVGRGAGGEGEGEGPAAALQDGPHMRNIAPLSAPALGKAPLARSNDWFAAQQFADPVTGKLQTLKYLHTPGWVWLMGRTAYAGSYGKVHLATSVHPDGANAIRVAIKEQRQIPKSTPDGRQKTYARAVEDIYTEINDFREMRRLIEEQCRAFDQRIVQAGYEPFALVRTGTIPTEVFDAYTDPIKQKTYMAMTLELGSVDMLRDSVDVEADTSGPRSPYLTALGASFGTQCFLELAAMHRIAHKAHLDLKLENVTFNRVGQFKLVDFGLARPLDGAGNTLGVGLDTGSLLSPEMVLAATAASNGQLTPVGRATDVHALAATALSLLAGNRGRSPFYKAQRLEEGVDAAGRPASRWVNDIDGCQAQMLDMQSLENAMKDAGFVAALHRSADATDLLQRAMPSASPETVEFLATCFARAPELTQRLMAGLQREPAARPDALTLANSLVELLPLATDPGPINLHAYFAHNPATAAQDQAFAQMQRFADLITQGS